MFLSINYSDLRPHIPELADSIAQELDVNTSQVRKCFCCNAGIFVVVLGLNVLTDYDSLKLYTILVLCMIILFFFWVWSI